MENNELTTILVELAKIQQMMIDHDKRDSEKFDLILGNGQPGMIETQNKRLRSLEYRFYIAIGGVSVLGFMATLILEWFKK